MRVLRRWKNRDRTYRLVRLEDGRATIEIAKGDQRFRRHYTHEKPEGRYPIAEEFAALVEAVERAAAPSHNNY